MTSHLVYDPVGFNNLKDSIRNLEVATQKRNDSDAGAAFHRCRYDWALKRCERVLLTYLHQSQRATEANAYDAPDVHFASPPRSREVESFSPARLCLRDCVIRSMGKSPP